MTSSEPPDDRQRIAAGVELAVEFDPAAGYDAEAVRRAVAEESLSTDRARRPPAPRAADRR